MIEEILIFLITLSSMFIVGIGVVLLFYIMYRTMK